MSRDLRLPAMNRASNRAVIRFLQVEAPLAAICSMRAEQIDRQRELEVGLQPFQAGRGEVSGGEHSGFDRVIEKS